MRRAVVHAGVPITAGCYVDKTIIVALPSLTAPLTISSLTAYNRLLRDWWYLAVRRKFSLGMFCQLETWHDANSVCLRRVDQLRLPPNRGGALVAAIPLFFVCFFLKPAIDVHEFYSIDRQLLFIPWPWLANVLETFYNPSKRLVIISVLCGTLVAGFDD